MAFTTALSHSFLFLVERSEGTKIITCTYRNAMGSLDKRRLKFQRYSKRNKITIIEDDRVQRLG